MNGTQTTHTLRVVGLALVLGLILAAEAYGGIGSGQNMPWNTPLERLLANLTGVTGKVLAGLMFVIGGAIWGFTRHEEGAKRFGQAIFGIGIMLGAVQFVDALGFTGAVV